MDTADPRRLLKANAIRSLGSKVAFNFEDFRRRCDEYADNVRRQAKKMIEEAQNDARLVRQQAHEEGQQAGLTEGLRDAEQQIRDRATEQADQMAVAKLKTTLPAMQAAGEALKLERERWLAEWEAAAVRLCAAIAGKLVRHDLKLNPHVAREMLVQTLELAAGNPHIKLRLNPDDLELLGDHAEEVVCSVACCAEATLLPDESISHGGCLIETQHGVIDARLETQLERITSELVQKS